MGYKGEKLASLAAPLDAGVKRFGRRLTNEVGGDLRKRVRRHTPVAEVSPEVMASYGSGASWVKARGGRKPGHLRDSWKIGTVTIADRGARYTIPVFTLDPVAPHVEWDTMPHLIRPKRPGGVLTIPTREGMIYASIVHHPGTRGAHMMATSLAEVAASWQRTARSQWAEEARRIWQGGRR